MKKYAMETLNRLRMLILVVVVISMVGLAYLEYLDGQALKAKGRAEELLTILEAYRLKNGSYPKSILDIGIKDSIETKNDRQFLYLKTGFTTTRLVYHRKSESEIEFSVGESGGLSVLNSKEKEWKWND